MHMEEIPEFEQDKTEYPGLTKEEVAEVDAIATKIQKKEGFDRAAAWQIALVSFRIDRLKEKEKHKYPGGKN